MAAFRLNGADVTSQELPIRNAANRERTWS